MSERRSAGWLAGWLAHRGTCARRRGRLSERDNNDLSCRSMPPILENRKDSDIKLAYDRQPLSPPPRRASQRIDVPMPLAFASGEQRRRGGGHSL